MGNDVAQAGIDQKKEQTGDQGERDNQNRRHRDFAARRPGNLGDFAPRFAYESGDAAFGLFVGDDRLFGGHSRFFLKFCLVFRVVRLRPRGLWRDISYARSA